MTRRRAATERDPRSATPGATVLVFDEARAHLRQAHDLAVALGYRAHPIDAIDEAIGVVSRAEPPDVVLAGGGDGEPLVRAALARGDNRPSVIVASSGGPAEAAARCDEWGADAYVTRPYRREPLACALRGATLLRTARRRVVSLERELAAERARLARLGDVDPLTGFHHFEIFQKLLVIELKRARRYGYPLAACLVSIDRRGEGRVERAIHAQVAQALRAVVRDIDLPVDYADGRFLVFLPYTDLPGAERVGRRLEATVRRGEAIDEDGGVVRPTVSVGISAQRPGREVSFAQLVRDAAVALRAAQLKGGGRVVVRGPRA